VKNDIKYIIDTYEPTGALYKRGGLPMFYIYDSYHISSDEWAKFFSKECVFCNLFRCFYAVLSSPETLRGTAYDGIFLGLYLDKPKSPMDITRGKFDGFYTYFAAAGFTHGSDPKNWHDLKNWVCMRLFCGKLFEKKYIIYKKISKNAAI